MNLKSILIRFGKFSCILLIGYVSLGIGHIIKDANNLADELDKLSHELDTDTGRFHSSVMEFDEICYSLNIYLAEPRVPDTLKERARSKIDELHDALERNDYDSVKSDLSMLKEISAEISQQNSFSEV
jgi:hypothetical protein